VLNNSKNLNGCKIHDGWENLRFSNEIADYLGNGTRKANGCHGTSIGIYRQPINPRQFQWTEGREA